MPTLEDNPDLVFGLVEVGSLTAEDLSFLTTALAEDYTGTDLDDLLELLEKGDAQIWKLFSPLGAGVLVTTIGVYPAGKELFVWLMAGRAMQHATPLIMKTLYEAAEAIEAKWIRSLSTPTVARWLKTHTGFELAYECLMLEVE